MDRGTRTPNAPTIPCNITKPVFAQPLKKPIKQNKKDVRKASDYHVYYFSNYSKKAYDECRDSLAFMEYMDGGLLSFQEGMTKPDPQMYVRFLERFQVAPQESIFIDDTEKNVLVAESLGFHSILFQTYEDAQKRLNTLGVQ